MAMSELVDIGTLIERRPDYRGGRPHIAGTGISVARIGILWGQGFTAEQLVDELYGVNLAQVYAALSYYQLNREAIDADIDAEDAETRRLMHEHYRLNASAR